MITAMIWIGTLFVVGILYTSRTNLFPWPDVDVENMNLIYIAFYSEGWEGLLFFPIEKEAAPLTLRLTFTLARLKPVTYFRGSAIPATKIMVVGKF